MQDFYLYMLYMSVSFNCDLFLLLLPQTGMFLSFGYNELYYYTTGFKVAFYYRSLVPSIFNMNSYR